MAIKSYNEIKNSQKKSKLLSFSEVYKKQNGVDYQEAANSSGQSTVHGGTGSSRNESPITRSQPITNETVSGPFGGAFQKQSEFYNLNNNPIDKQAAYNSPINIDKPNTVSKLLNSPDIGNLDDLQKSSVPLAMADKKGFGTDIKYAGMKLASGAASGANIVPGVEAILGSALSGGEQDEDFKKLSEYFAKNPQEKTRFLGSASNLDIANKAGVSQQYANAYKKAHSLPYIDEQVENAFSRMVSPAGTELGRFAYMAGNQIPAAIYPGQAGTLIMMGLNSAGSNLVSNADTHGQNSANIPNALLKAGIEVASEKVLGGVGLKGSWKAFENGAGGVLKNSLEEGAEEAIADPASRLVDKLTYSPDMKWFGDGGVVDPSSILSSFKDGFILSAITGGAGATVNAISTKANKTNDFQQAAEELNKVIGNMPEEFRPRYLDTVNGVSQAEFEQRAAEVNKIIAGVEKAVLPSTSLTPIAQGAPQATQASIEPTRSQTIPETITAPKATVQSVYGENGQKAFESEITNNQNNPLYESTFRAFYEGSKNGDSFENINRQTNSASADIQAKLMAYSSGQNDLKLEKANAKIKKIGGVIQSSFSKQVKSQESEIYETVETLGRAIQRPIAIHDTLPVNGYYENGVIHIAMDAENPMLDVAKHEVTHALKDTSPKAYQDLSAYIISSLKKAGAFDSISTQIKNDYGALIKNDGDLNDEIVAHTAEDFFKSADSINALAKANKTLAEKIKDTISNLLEKFKTALSKMPKGNPNYAEMALGVEQLKTAEKLWIKALNESNGKTESDSVKLSKKLGGFNPDINVSTSSIDVFGIKNINNVKEVKDKVYLHLKNSYISTPEISKPIKNIDTGIEIEIRKRGINETFGNANAYKNLNSENKKIKLATMASLAKLIKYGEVRAPEAGNYHNTQSNATYAYLISPIVVDGEFYNVEMDIRKSNRGNNFYIHKIKSAVRAPKSGSESRTKLKSLTADNSVSQKNTSVNNNISENKKNDTKYSLKPNTEEGRKALEENARLREANENLKREFTLTKGNRFTDKSAADKLASRYSRDYNIKGSTEEISRNIQQSFNLINGMARDNLSWDAVQDITGLLAEKILDKAVYVDDTIYQQYSDLRKYLRATKISISSTDKSSIADFNDFRKQNIGRLRLSQDGTAVDVIWQELAENYPEFFDENDTLHPADKLQYIADLSKSLDKSYKEFKTTVEYDTAKKMLSNQLWEDYLDTPQEKKTYADKVQEKLMLEKAHSAARLRELRSSKNENIARLKADNISRVNAVISRERTRSEDKQKQIKAHAKEIFDNYRDRRNKTSLKDKVWKKTRELHKMLTNPTEKKYVSEEMKKPIAEFLESVVNAYKTDTGTIAEIKRDKMINAYRKMIENTDSEFTYDFDEDMLDMLDSIPDKKIADMTAAEIENLNRVIVSLTKTVTESNILRRNEKYKDITDAGNRMINDLAALKSKSNVSNEIVDKINNMVNSDMLQPREFFEQLGNVGLSIYNEFRNALDKKIINIKNAQDYMANLIKEKNISEWTGKKSHATKFNVSGGEIELTPTQVMYLYLLSEREQAQNHIYVGGIKQAPVIATYTEKDGKGNDIKKKKIKSNSAPVKVSPEDVANIINTLTSEQKTVADGIGKFLTETTSEWANEVSLEMYGYKKFTEKKYIPMKSDENYLKSEFGVQRDGTIKNAGWTKSTVKKANNPLIMEDIFDVFTRQADEASTYNAFVVPLSDMQKIMNYKNTEVSVKQSVQQKLGNSAISYVSKFANDVNGGIRTEPGTGIVKTLLRNYKSAAMGLNARVIIQQPTALIRATAEINPKYLIQGVTGKVSFDEVKKYVPIALWKDLGYFTTDTGRQMRDIFLGKKGLSDYTMAGIAKADNMAWRVLWNAVEAETKDLHSDIEYGSDKYYEICRDRFNYITDKTQVVDTVLHRSQLTRSNDTAVKVYSSFMSEPIKTYNLLRSVYRNYIIDKTPENSKKVRQTSIAFVATSAATAFMCTLADLWRSDDEDEKFWEIYFGNLVNDATGMIPILRDITSIANGFSPKRMEYSGFEKLGYAFKRFNKNIKALQAGQPPQYTWSQVTSDFARGLGELTGIPANSTFREIEAIYDNIANASKSYEMKYARQKMSYNIRNEDNAGKFKKILWEAYSEGSPEVAQPILNDMLANGYVKADLFAYIESELRKQARTDPVMNDLYQSWKSSDKDSIGKFLEKAKKKGYSEEQISYGFDYLRDEDKLTYGSPKKIYAFIQSGQKKKAAEMFNAMIESGLWTEEEIDSGYEKYASQTKSDLGLE